MQTNPGFWTVFKADLLFSICSIIVSVIVVTVVAWWKKRKMAKKAPAGSPNLDGPRAFIIGGTNPKPHHCPLCGLDWPMPGPIVTAPPAAPSAHKSSER